MTNSLLSIDGLCKNYTVPVLRGIDIEIWPGEVHALMGANGAGKSTLCNIIAGQVPADDGEMKFHNRLYRPTSVSDAESAGIRMVTQELRLIDTLSVAENISLAALPQRAGFINYNLINQQAGELLQRFGLTDIDPGQQLNSLSIGQQQLVEIARVLNHSCDLLILDEPTAALSEEQIELLFREIGEIKNQGSAIIYVSHRMDEISRIADRTMVLRDGLVVANDHTEKLSRDDLIRLMTGHPVANASNFDKRHPGPLALKIENLSTREKLNDINLDVYQGEVLGISGLMGSGRTELLRAIFGADRRSHGDIKIGPEMRPARIRSPVDAVSNGIGLINEDRKQQGLLPELSILQNISLACLAQFAGKIGWLDSARALQDVEKQIENLSVDCTNTRQKVNELSGGNQQKVIIARWLLMNCNIMLFDEPTRGIDIQTKQMIYDLVDNLARLGKAIVVASSEANELLSICDRIAVLSNGKLAEIFRRDQWSPEAITAAAFTHYSGQKITRVNVPINNPPP
ncbi:MAG TPA: sugar ABC transporter ATP-binding protein [Gammaproteobacteria bacterium]|jgi:ribose transport system ATP-binding protein|nr:sugar ABC transporter ATP-binding protein [Gammaproteobacteria bacterium]